LCFFLLEWLGGGGSALLLVSLVVIVGLCHWLVK